MVTFVEALPTEGQATGGCSLYVYPAQLQNDQLQDNRDCVLCMTFSVLTTWRLILMTSLMHTFNPVYGPVNSWRFGRSLGIDAIGSISTCPFNCVYCQLGDIQHQTTHRQVFVSTAQIRQALKKIDPATAIDVITLSGSGEPTLALNLDEILACAKAECDRPVIVLTNGTLLGDRAVRSALMLVDQVVIKLDALSEQQLQRINRPVADVAWKSLLSS